MSALLQPNVNTIQVVVGSTLKNRLMQRGYISSNPNPVEPSYGVRSSYGMIGEVKLVTYAFEQLASVADIRSDEGVVAVNSPASYTISLSQAKGAGIVTLNFTYDGRYLNLADATPLGGFEFAPGGGLTWEYVGGQAWKGTVKLIYPGFVQVDDPLDILKISGMARNGIVDLADMIEIIANYCDSYNLYP